jgi:hypothetical protein
MKGASGNTLRTRPESNEKKRKHKNSVKPRKIADEQVNKVEVLRIKL